MNGHDTPLAPFESGIKGFDPNDLYDVRVVTDLAAGEIKVLQPILETGGRDNTKAPRYFSNCMVMFRGQHYQCQFEITAVSLADAIGAFKGAADLASRNMIAELEAQHTKSRLMVPPGVGGRLARPN